MVVALRKESVDRNTMKSFTAVTALIVALRKESVDRNFHDVIKVGNALRSLSARRAWIEIAVMEPLPPFPAVALRKESVDRNKQKAKYDRDGNMSLSARRAWIEIAKLPAQCGWEVSLSARRAWIEIKVQPQTGQRNRRRSPQGERG